MRQAPHRAGGGRHGGYLRLHGDEELYASSYSDAALEAWAGRIRAWAAGSQPDDARLALAVPPRKRAGRDVYCYFDNDVKVHAPYDAATLARKLALPSSLPPRVRMSKPRPEEPVRGGERRAAQTRA